MRKPPVTDRLKAALADLDDVLIEPLLEQARAEASAEVVARLRQVFVDDLMERALQAIEAAPEPQHPIGLVDVPEGNEQAPSAELDRLGDCVEWALVVRATEEAAAEAATVAAVGAESAYLEQRLAAGEAAAQRARAAERAERWHARLGDVATDARVQQPREQSALLDGSYLVPRARQREFDLAAASVQDEAAELGLELRLTGPSPPRSFVPQPEH
jgi:hypothetical protein